MRYFQFWHVSEDCDYIGNDWIVGGRKWLEFNGRTHFTPVSIFLFFYILE